MIHSIELTAFKKFAEVRLQLSPLTVLTGLNATGKSSIVQALLLAHQASLSAGTTVALWAWPDRDLGQASDLLNVNATDSLITVVLESNGRHIWQFDTGPPGEDDVPYLKIRARPEVPPSPFGSMGSEFTYLSAERLGPRTSHPTSPSHPDDAVLGEDGRFVAHALAVRSRADVDPGRRHPKAGEITTLQAQVEAWLGNLVGPTQLEASLVPRTSIATLKVRTPGRTGEWMLPTNTGFGISYCLPVVVAGLLAPRGGLLVVDSPEAHLHPAAQSAMGVFLATIAASGVQVIVETHSDHVLNGIRKSVSVRDIIESDLVKIIFFGHVGPPTVLSLSDRGNLSEWPSGFFDQYEADLGEITRARGRNP